MFLFALLYLIITTKTNHLPSTTLLLLTLLVSRYRRIYSHGPYPVVVVLGVGEVYVCVELKGGYRFDQLGMVPFI